MLKYIIMAKLHEYFLKAIFNDKEVKSNQDIGDAVSVMTKYNIMPKLLMKDDDYTLYYTVSFDDIKHLDLDEGQAFAMHQEGWCLDETETNLIRIIG